MRVCYSSGYVAALPEGHRFPMPKFSLLFELLLREGVVRPEDVVEPQEADWEDLRLVHSAEYLADLAHGTLSPAALRRLGLPWSAALLRRSRLAVQGTVLAARMALEDGVAANLAGGTHHAFADRGEGFCLLNDVCVAIRILEREGRIRRALVVDLDVHQGNGTATLCDGRPEVFTFSIHGERNYPFRKARSSLDVGLPNHVGDGCYLDMLESHLPAVIEQARPDVAFYLAGVDPVEGDRFGRLDLSPAGLEQREQYVLETLRRAGLPVVLTLSGGYAATPQATAELHACVHRAARRVFG